MNPKSKKDEKRSYLLNLHGLRAAGVKVLMKQGISSEVLKAVAGRPTTIVTKYYTRIETDPPDCLS